MVGLFFKFGSKYEALHDLAVVGLSPAGFSPCSVRAGRAAGKE
jgi:hypothetical protein